jgi:hypothetical protein
MRAARQGDRVRATELFQAALEQDPGQEEALLWLAALAEHPGESVVYLERVLATNPHNARAQAGLRWATERLEAREALPEAPLAPAWGGTVDLVPLEAAGTRLRLTTVVGSIAAVLLLGILAWWAWSGFPFVQLVVPGATATEPAPTVAPPATNTSLPDVVTAVTPSVAAIPSETPLPPPPTATATVVTPLPSETLSSAPSTATATVVAATPATTPSPLHPTVTVTWTPSATPSPVPTPATVWPTPGPTTSPWTTPQPTPWSYTAPESSPVSVTPGETVLPGRG